MEISKIEARDLSEAWFLCLRQTLKQGYEYQIERGSYAGQRRKELDLVTVQVKNPGARQLIPDVPQGVPPPTTMEYVESYLPYLMTAHRRKGEQYTYGQYLEKQIARVIRMYREDGHNTNQAFMAVGSRRSISLAIWFEERVCGADTTTAGQKLAIRLLGRLLYEPGFSSHAHGAFQEPVY